MIVANTLVLSIITSRPDTMLYGPTHAPHPRHCARSYTIYKRSDPGYCATDSGKKMLLSLSSLPQRMPDTTYCRSPASLLCCRSASLRRLTTCARSCVLDLLVMVSGVFALVHLMGVFGIYARWPIAHRQPLPSACGFQRLVSKCEVVAEAESVASWQVYTPQVVEPFDINCGKHPPSDS
jgi:hypothetical protein